MRLRLHRAIGSRRRRLVIASGAALLVASAGLGAVLDIGPAGAANVTISTTCSTNLGISVAKSFTLGATLPASVTAGVSFDGTLVGVPTTLKAVDTLPISQYRNVFTTYTISGGTMTLAPTPQGNPTWKGATIAARSRSTTRRRSRCTRPARSTPTAKTAGSLRRT